MGVGGARESRARVRTLKGGAGARGDETTALEKKGGGVRHRGKGVRGGGGEPGTGKW